VRKVDRRDERARFVVDERQQIGKRKKRHAIYHFENVGTSREPTPGARPQKEEGGGEPTNSGPKSASGDDFF